MSPHLLIIENDNDFRAAISYYLRSKGYDVTEAATGREGLDLATRESPDLILLDLLLPDGDGASFAREMQKAEATCHIPVIAISGAADLRDCRRNLAVFRECLQKPFPVAKLIEVIGRNLEPALMVR